MADKVTNKAVNDWLRGKPPATTEQPQKAPVPTANAGAGSTQTAAFAAKIDMNAFMRNARRGNR